MIKQKDLSRGHLLKKARKMAVNGLNQYSISSDYKVSFIGISDNITYRVATPSKEKYLFRLHWNERLDRDEINSELVWLEHVKNYSIAAPEGVKNLFDTYVTEVKADMKGGKRFCTLMKWVEGELNNEKIGPEHIHGIGSLMAKLHSSAREFQPDNSFKRPEWGVKSIIEDMDKLRQNYESFMSKESYYSFQGAVEKICIKLENMIKTDSSYGMIHGDLHLENVVFHEGKPRAIDFGRCGYGYFMYDIAQSLVGIIPPGRRVFLEGYKSGCELPESYIKDIETFFIMACIENISFHSSNPEERENLIKQVPYVLRLIEQFEHEKPFLFGIEK